MGIQGMIGNIGLRSFAGGRSRSDARVPYFRLAPIKRFTSPGSAWRPNAFLEKTRSESTLTSNTPPSEGIRVKDCISVSHASNNSAVRLTARGP